MSKLPKIENHIAVGNDDSEETKPFPEKKEVTTAICSFCGIVAEVEDMFISNTETLCCPECLINQ